MIERISDHVFMIDLETGGYREGIAVYIIIGDKGAALVDTGPKCSVGNLVEKLRAICKHDAVRYVLGTHIHLDHFGGAATALRSLRSANIYVHPRGSKHVINPEKLWSATLRVLGEIAEFYEKPDPAPEDRVLEIKDEEELDLGNVSIWSIYTPGHAPHHVSYYIEPDGVMITGDSVGIYYRGLLHPVSLHPFDLDNALDSIKRMISFSPRYVAFSHFGVDFSGVKVLEKGIEKIKKWCDIIGKIPPAYSFEKVYSEVLEKDPELKEIIHERERIPYFKGSGRRCVYGLYMALRATKVQQVDPSQR